MTPTIFDIETTAIDCFRTLKGLESIHCLVIRQGNDTTYYTKENMVEGLKFLRNQDLIVGHNVTGFDILRSRSSTQTGILGALYGTRY